MSMQGIMVHVSPEALEPVIHDWCGGAVYILDAETEGVIGRGKIVVTVGDRITVKPAPDFPSDFFRGDFGKVVEQVGIRYNKLDGLPPLGLSEAERAGYRNTKVVSIDYFDLKQEAAKKQKELVVAVLECFEPGQNYAMQDFLPVMAKVGLPGLTLSGKVFSKALGELLARGFLMITYDSTENSIVIHRR